MRPNTDLIEVPEQPTVLTTYTKETTFDPVTGLFTVTEHKEYYEPGRYPMTQTAEAPVVEVAIIGQNTAEWTFDLL